MRYFLYFFILFGFYFANSFGQSFPSPSSLSTGQGALGATDPNWQVSQQCFATGTEPNPTNAVVTYSPAYILSSTPGTWINPVTLPAPFNNGHWIGASSSFNDAGGCARYYRLTLNLPANCGTVTVTNAGAYTLTFDGYVDNTLKGVYLNGVNQGVTPGGSFGAGGQLTFTIPGPWLVGTNYIDVLVENGGSSSNPAGFLLVASPSAASKDSDGDGISDENDTCPCGFGNTNNGCAGVAPNDCNLAAIRSAFTGAGCTELFSCYNGCSLYFYYPTAGSSQAAETFAQSLGGHIVSIQSATENNCLKTELNSNGFGGVIWIGYTDNITEGSFYWLDGSPNGYTNWNSSQPDNASNEDCVQMYPSGTWNDLPCSINAASILEVGLCPQATIVSNTLQICRGSSTTLSISTLFGSAPYNYTWTPSFGLSTNTASTTIASPSVTTSYTVQSTDRYNCTTYAYVTLTVNPTPTLAVNSATICRGIQTATLIATGAISYSWSPATGLSSTTGSLVVGSPTTSINSYIVTGATALGCVSSATTLIKVNNIPNITVSSTSSAICLGQQSSNLSAGGAISYSWSPGTGLSATIGANVVANPITTTTYNVVGINGFGCPNFTTTTIVVNPLPIIGANSTSICLGQQTATITATGANTYNWAPPTDLNTIIGPIVLAKPNTSLTYTILGTDINGCKNIGTTFLTVLELPNISSNSGSICIGQQSITLTATGATSYSWIPTGNLSASSGFMVVANPTVNTTYTVVGIDMRGCYNYSTSTVAIKSLPLLVVNSPSICIGQQTATLTINGANTYSWIPSLNLSSTTGSLVIATPSLTSSYSVQGIDNNGCINLITNTITVLPLPLLSVNDASICMGQQTATLTVSGASSYTWLPTLSTSSIITLMPLTNSSYTVIGTDVMGCMNYTISNVAIYPIPTIAVNDASICIGQQTATLSASGGISYTWTQATDLSSNTGSLVTTSPMATSVFTVIGRDGNGCYDDTTSTVTVYELPLVAVNSSSVCLGQFPANLLPIGASSYTWEPIVTYNQSDGSDVDANPTVPTDYTVTGIDIYGCYNSTTTNVGFYVIPTASLTVSDSVLCIGESFVLMPSGGTSSQVLPNNLFTLDNFTLSPTTTSSYTITVFTDDGCYSENYLAITITVNPLPIITAFTNTIISIGQTTSINASGGLTYVWSPTDGLTCTTCAPTNAHPLENTTYTVTGYDSNGCASTNTLYVQVDYICGDYFVPNVFSPNGDGMNDFVNLHSACVGTYTLQIFDRWGEKVFETSDFSYSWDGSFRGKPMDTGVFVYQAKGLDLKGTAFSVKGNVTLLR